MKRPNRKTIERVISWLQEQDISIYGPNMDPDTGEEYPALMDYTADSAIKRYEHIKNDTLWYDEEYYP